VTRLVSVRRTGGFAGMVRSGEIDLDGDRVPELGALVDRVVYASDFTEERGVAAAEELLARYPDVDGIAAASDLIALGALRVLHEHGRRVPEDVALTGYDDLGIAGRTDPPLTTLRNPISEMAGHAVRLLLEQLDGGAATPVRVIFPPTLVRRTSG
jgi:DNA-binding LacI/PurR family transcriptional regulator